MKTKTLLLDLDGTLLGSSARLHGAFVWRTIAYFARRRVGPVKALRALHGLRMGIENHEPGLVNSRRAARNFAAVLGLSEEAGYEQALALTREVFPRLESCFFPISGAAEFIGWARSRYKLVLATNAVWPRDVVELRLKWAGLDAGLFSYICNNDEMHFTKPSVEYYEELVAKLSLEPRESLMIGDSFKKDLPARHAGIPVFLLAPGAQAVAHEENAWKGSFTALRTFLEEQNA